MKQPEIEELCPEAQKRIDSLEQEVENLKHDIERHIRIASEAATLADQQ